jgi:hypothetical protein
LSSLVTLPETATEGALKSEDFFQIQSADGTFADGI